MAEKNENRREGVSPETDALASELMGDALDLMAAGEAVNVLLVVEDAAGNVASYAFSDDGAEACLEGARAHVRHLAASHGDAKSQLGDPIRYALTYEGAVDADEDGSFADALLLEFGERGWCAYSAYSLVDGKGTGDGFSWTEPAAAGEMEPLL